MRWISLILLLIVSNIVLAVDRRTMFDEAFFVQPEPTSVPSGLISIEFNNPTNSAGTNGYAVGAVTGTLKPDSPWTFECWVAKVGDNERQSEAANGRTVFGLLSGNWDTGGFGFYVNNLEFATYNTDIQSPLQGIIETTVFATYYQWHHIAVTCDGTDSKWWLDGACGLTNNADWDLSGMPNYAFYLARGNRAHAVDTFNPFRIKMVRISNVARYSSDFTPYTAFTNDANTLGLWKCNEGSGTNLLDSSGNGYDLTINGTGYKWITE